MQYTFSVRNYFSNNCRVC